MALTLAKEAYDDYKRYKRDKESNSARYRLIRSGQLHTITSQDIRVRHMVTKVGDLIEIHAKERVPADIVILATSEPSGSIFIKTDQLDGETAWKVRRAVRTTHSLLTADRFTPLSDSVVSYAPACEDIYEFLGSFSGEGKRESLSLDNTAWANTVLAAGWMVGLVVFTGRETRAQMNSREPRTKVGRFDDEINWLSKILFGLMLCLALVMNMFRELNLLWPLYFFRYSPLDKDTYCYWPASSPSV